MIPPGRGAGEAKVPKPISPHELKALMEGDSPHAVVDVRLPVEFNAEQIFRTTNVPRGSLEFRIGLLVPVRSTPVVLVDGGGARARLAAESLEREGYTDVTRLEGGLPDWKSAGLPTISGTNVPSKEFGERVQHEQQVPEILADEMHALIEGGGPVRIFDARTEKEFERFSIPGGRSLPNGELILHVWDILQDDETPVVVNCAGRTRSIMGAQALRRLGVKNVRALRNGVIGFFLKGIPVEEGKRGEVSRPSERGIAYAEELAAALAEEEGIPSISAEELRCRRERADRETLYLLDVRRAPEYSGGHIPGAVSLPGGQAIQRTDEAIAVRAGTVVTCCDASARATMVAYWLRRMGLRHVFFLKGGTEAWRTAGQPLVSSEAAAWGEGPVSDSEPIGLAGALEASRGLSPEEAAEFIGEGERIVLLDVDLSRSYVDGHLSGAKWISRDWLEDRIGDWAPDKGTPLLLTCEGGLRSAFAARTLFECGHREVFRLAGGKRAWREAGRPLDKGGEGIVGDPQDVVLKPYDFEKEAMLRSMENYIEWEVNLGKKYEEERK